MLGISTALSPFRVASYTTKALPCINTQQFAAKTITKDQQTLETSGMIDEFMDLPPGKRNYLIRKIGEAVKPDTREKRIREALDITIERNARKLSPMGTK
ncbi:YdeI/OmpD-associated family protein [Motilimonas sp. E26]|uniref:YdeI/OmpD-associated family protein n=1 Tax=Motilimonas sp. E26 TaxID=2865674 RepID=UPI0032B736DE